MRKPNDMSKCLAALEQDSIWLVAGVVQGRPSLDRAGNARVRRETAARSPRTGAAHDRGGQALRGSSELHAWGDSNLYLRRQAQNLYFNIEHRAAPGTDRLLLALKTNPPALALEVIEPSPARASQQRIEQILAEATSPITQRQLREAARMRANHVTDAVARLVSRGRVSRSADGISSGRNVTVSRFPSL
jgi:hypothetical protein